MECSICNTEFNEFENIPLLVGCCNHNVCKKCCPKDIKEQCFYCRQSISSRKVNLALLEFIKSKKQSLTSMKVVLCSADEKHGPAKWYYPAQDSEICDSCL
jgi:hypothetical protein